MKRGLSSATVLLALAVLGGCESIAGIEDRTFEPGGSTGSALCKTYCQEVISACTGTRAVYASEDACLATCAALPPGSEGDTNTNSVQCRIRQAKLAVSTGETGVHCPGAGPGGSGACGTNCESYCDMYEQACPEEAELVTDCRSGCLGLKDDRGFDVEANYNGDTLQCRLVHLASALINPEVHCSHSRLAPLPGEPCTDPEDVLPTCEDYCRLVMISCDGDNAVYESSAQCLSACASFDVGLSSHTVEDSLGCRKYHAYSALSAPEIHCSHASLGGDGHCGLTNCPAYCKLFESRCETEFGAAFASTAECETACSSLPGAPADSGFKLSDPDGNDLGCRIRHLLRADVDPSACTGAAGGGSCQ